MESSVRDDRKHLVVRREFLTTAMALGAASRVAAFDATSPIGRIHRMGTRATFSVDFPRPMESVVYSFVHTYGWSITFEEAPLVYAGDIVDVTKNFSRGRRAFNPRGGKLEFSFDAGPQARPPEDPAAVLEAAIEAYHRAGFPGKYKLLQVDGYMHIVPTARLDEGGVWEPAQSPLDAVVSLEGRDRYPDDVVDDLLQLMQRDSEYRVVIGRAPFTDGIQPRIKDSFKQVKARAVLRAIIAETGKRRIWYMMYWIKHSQYFLSIL